MVLGNIDNHRGLALIAFIDLLGFSKEIETNWKALENDPIQKLLKLKNNLPHYSNFSEEDICSKTKRKYPCRIQTISDSVVVSFGFNTPLDTGDFLLGLMSFLGNISLIWRNAIEVGFTVRGAMDLGEIFWDGKEIVGPAFINAYSLEQTHAKTSRVIVSSNLNKELKRLLSTKRTLFDDEILDYLSKDIDGILILNPHSLYDGAKDKSHVVSMLSEIQSNSSGSMNKEKYSPLLAILSSEAREFDRTWFGQY